MKLKLSNISPKIITIAIGGIAVGLVVALVVGLWPQPKVLPSVAATNPQDGEENTLNFQRIIITFQQDLETGQQEEVLVEIQPLTNLNSQWTTNNVLQLVPTQPLEGKTTYTISINYRGETIYTFSFHTVSLSAQEAQEQSVQQIEDDLLYAKAQKEWYQDNPWYAGLPIVTDEFTIVYDVEEKSFRIRITLEDGATNAEINAAKQEALDDLEDIGADPNTQGYYFIVK